MKKILYYYLSYRKGANGYVTFRLEGESQDRQLEFDPVQFAAVAAVLAQKRITFHLASGTFVSFDDAHSPVTDEHIIV
jgi:hypothetical protein